MQRSNNHSHIKSSSNPRALRSDSPLSLIPKKKMLPLHRQGRACSSTNVALPASMALRTRLRYARPHGRRVVQHRPAQLSLSSQIQSLSLSASPHRFSSESIHINPSGFSLALSSVCLLSIAVSSGTAHGHWHCCYSLAPSGTWPL